MTVEKLQQEVDDKLVSVRDALDKVDQQRQRLSDNAIKLKSRISEKVEHHVNCLRKREQLLLRQVDVGSTQQNSLLSTQNAKLLHCEGALMATKRLLSRCSDDDVPTLAKVQFKEIPMMKSDRMLKSMIVQLDDKELSSVIASFGRVHLSDQITQHTSSIIPNKMEDYGDEDHDILHKSVVPDYLMEPNPYITVKIPRLPSDSQLSDVSKQNMKAQLQTENMKKQSPDISEWLSSIHLGSADDGEDSSIGELMRDFSVIDSESNPESTKTSFSSSSIEIISRFSSEKGFECPDTLCEIENLDKIIEDKSTWLKCPSLSVKSACCANEPCKSFDECRCEGVCKKNAIEKIMQTANWKAKTDRKRSHSEIESSNSFSDYFKTVMSQDAVHWLKKSKVRENNDFVNKSGSQILQDLRNIRKMAHRHWISKKLHGACIVPSPTSYSSATAGNILKEFNVINNTNKTNWLKVPEQDTSEPVFDGVANKDPTFINAKWLKKTHNNNLMQKMPSNAEKPTNPVDSISECMKVLRKIDSEKWLHKISNRDDDILDCSKSDIMHSQDNFKDKVYWLSKQQFEDLPHSKTYNSSILQEMQHIKKLDKNTWLQSNNKVQRKVDKLKLEIEGEKEQVNSDLSKAFDTLNLQNNSGNAHENDYNNIWLTKRLSDNDIENVYNKNLNDLIAPSLDKWLRPKLKE